MRCRRIVLLLAGILLGSQLTAATALGLEGIVLAVPKPDLCEISVGSDDGVKKGHTLDVFRVTDKGAKYVGRIVVMKTSYDRAACRVDPKFQKLPLQRGDRVKPARR